MGELARRIGTVKAIFPDGDPKVLGDDLTEALASYAAALDKQRDARQGLRAEQYILETCERDFEIGWWSSEDAQEVDPATGRKNRDWATTRLKAAMDEDETVTAQRKAVERWQREYEMAQDYVLWRHQIAMAIRGKHDLASSFWHVVAAAIQGGI